jgi:hypothetical protein
MICVIAACDRAPTEPADARSDSIRAITLVDWSADGYDSPPARDEIAALAATGANTLVLVVTAWQDSPHSNRVQVDPARTPTPHAVTAATAWARTFGLRVALKPHVDLIDGSWRGTIDPSDAHAWFDSYLAFILPWADLARIEGMSFFVAGTELAGTTGMTDSWHRVMHEIRQRFEGPVVYAASWDEAERVGFWGAVDWVGVDAYWPVARRKDAGRFELLAGWQPWIARLEALHAKADRPLLITEIGYRSVVGAGLQPFRFGDAGVADPQEQADLYWAAMQAIAPHQWISGIVWWSWSARGGGGLLDTDYTPAGKLAEVELQRAWLEPRSGE